MAASLPTPAADTIPKSLRAAASALFEITSQSSPTSNSVPTELRVLPALTVEGDRTPVTEQAQDDPLPLHEPSSPAIEARASPRKTKARKQVAVSAPADIGAGPQMAPAGDDGAMAGTSEPRTASLPAVRRRLCPPAPPTAGGARLFAAWAALETAIAEVHAVASPSDGDRRGIVNATRGTTDFRDVQGDCADLGRTHGPWRDPFRRVARCALPRSPSWSNG